LAWDGQWTREPGNGLTDNEPTLLTEPNGPFGNGENELLIGVEGDGDNRPWLEILTYANATGETFTLDQASPSTGEWAPQNDGNISVFTENAPALANLRGDQPEGLTDPTFIIEEGSNHILERRRLD
jgi:hypothetical protein